MLVGREEHRGRSFCRPHRLSLSECVYEVAFLASFPSHPRVGGDPSGLLTLWINDLGRG